MASNEEKRKHFRFDCKGTAQVYFTPLAAPCSAEVLNLSVSGGLIVLQQSRDTSSGEKIELAFTVNQIPFRVRAQVRAVRSDLVFGVLFELSERVKGHLEDLIEELAAKNRSGKAQKL